MEVLENWLKHKFKFEDISESDYVFGKVINKVFCNSRFQDLIIKEAHFMQGASSVYRKGLNFLLTHQEA